MATMTRSGTNGTNGFRPSSIGGLLAVLASVAVSVASADALGESVRIRWSVGTYYGPEHAPATIVLVAFPLALTGLYVGFRLLGGYLDRVDGFDEVRILYEVSVLASLLALLGVHVALVAANL